MSIAGATRLAAGTQPAAFNPAGARAAALAALKKAKAEQDEAAPAALLQPPSLATANSSITTANSSINTANGSYGASILSPESSPGHTRPPPPTTAAPSSAAPSPANKLKSAGTDRNVRGQPPVRRGKGVTAGKETATIVVATKLVATVAEPGASGKSAVATASALAAAKLVAKLRPKRQMRLPMGRLAEVQAHVEWTAPAVSALAASLAAETQLQQGEAESSHLGKTVASQCKCLGGGLESVIVRQPASFTIEACDGQGERRDEGGEPFAITIRACGLRMHAKMEDHGNGLYTVGFKAESSGRFLIGVALRGEQLPGSPFTCVARAAVPVAMQCVLSGSSLTRAVARVVQSFDITFRDVAGQVAHAEDLDVYVRPTGATAALAYSAALGAVSVSSARGSPRLGRPRASLPRLGAEVEGAAPSATGAAFAARSATEAAVATPSPADAETAPPWQRTAEDELVSRERQRTAHSASADAKDRAAAQLSKPFYPTGVVVARTPITVRCDVGIESARVGALHPGHVVYLLEVKEQGDGSARARVRTRSPRRGIIGVALPTTLPDATRNPPAPLIRGPLLRGRPASNRARLPRPCTVVRGLVALDPDDEQGMDPLSPRPEDLNAYTLRKWRELYPCKPAWLETLPKSSSGPRGDLHSPRSPRRTFAEPIGWVTVSKEGRTLVAVSKQLAAGARQAHIQAWERRLAVDRATDLQGWQTSMRAMADSVRAVQNKSKREGNRKKEKDEKDEKDEAIAAAAQRARQSAAGPSTNAALTNRRIFENEKTSDPTGIGFAFGGVMPGRIHAHGKPQEVLGETRRSHGYPHASSRARRFACCDTLRLSPSYRSTKSTTRSDRSAPTNYTSRCASSPFPSPAALFGSRSWRGRRARRGRRCTQELPTLESRAAEHAKPGLRRNPCPRGARRSIVVRPRCSARWATRRTEGASCFCSRRTRCATRARSAAARWSARPRSCAGSSALRMAPSSPRRITSR